MINTLFADEIVNSSDLRNNQKRWLELACNKPITVNYGRKQLAIMNREQLSGLYKAIYYLELVVKVCEEFEKSGKSRILPWANDLPEKDRAKFHEELVNGAIHAAATNDWSEIEYLLEDWKATAEVENNPKLVEALIREGNPEEYVRYEE